MQGQYREGLGQMDQGQSAILATGQTLSLPFCLVLCAEVAERVGQVAEGLDWLAEAIKMLETSKGDLLAEAYRLKGELLLRQQASDAVQAEDCFRQALNRARQQQQILGACAATSLGRLWQQQGKR